MHDQGIIHGDLKGINVLIDNNGRACLTGFSLLTLASDEATVTPSTGRSGTVRWMSPERLFPEKFDLKEPRPTKESDCYSLGMTIYEVLSGEVPFAQEDRVISVMFKVMDGRIPNKPQGTQERWFTDGLWEVLELCWRSRPDERPGLDTVLQCLRGATRAPRTSSEVDLVTADMTSPQGGGQLLDQPRPGDPKGEQTAGSLMRRTR